MLFTNIASSALVASAFVIPSVLASVTVRWNPKGNCSGRPGPERTYDSGVCISLSATSDAVNIISRTGSCNLVSYSNSGCSGTRRNLNNEGCWSLQGKWSARVEC